MLRNTPLLSVVVPVYNVEQYLDRCVSSIVNQTYKNLEIILVDDGSTDSSGKLCDEWAAKDKRVQVFHKPNGGLVSARQAGTAISNGEYIAQVDSDDWIERDMYAELMSLAVEHDADVVTSGTIKDYSNHYVLDKELTKPGIYTEESLNQLLSNLISLDTFFQPRISLHIINKIYKKSLYLKAQISVSQKINMSEDVALVLYLFLRSKKIVVTENSFYHYCVREGSICGVVKNDMEGLNQLRKFLLFSVCGLENKIPSIKKQISLVYAYTASFISADSFFFIKKHCLLPYNDVKSGQKILLYGAGKFGQRLYIFLKRHPEFKIIAWTDKVSKNECISVEEALKLDYDIILLAIALASPAQNAYNELCSKGVPPEKIKRLDVTKILENSI